MTLRRLVVNAGIALTLSVGVLGCIHRTPETTGPQDEPHFSWEIAFHGVDAVRHSDACTSASRTACELPIDTSGKPLSSDFVVYLHPASSEVTYTGLVEVGFMHDDPKDPVKLPINQKVPPASVSHTPIQASVSGGIATKPGTYRVSIKIVATMNDKSTSLQDAFVVTLRASTGTGQR